MVGRDGDDAARGSEVAADDANAPVALDAGLRGELAELTATLCKALNDPKRLLLIYALADGPRSVGALADTLGASQTNVSQHLAILRERGVVGTERRGPSVIYSLRYPELIGAVDQLRAILSRELDRRQQLVAG
ncbi:MAG TPA: metalloregulator ArsR/SmtB family transcription factor [Egicoccus sp.]|nr:metalloregulator ArsR/SmtB family transcription factor [Egicoccus sp.]HSK22450.1 metalloregulator ArsR/SmtB family transcription factor [Egicoccus sp.]